MRKGPLIGVPFHVRADQRLVVFAASYFSCAVYLFVIFLMLLLGNIVFRGSRQSC